MKFLPTLVLATLLATPVLAQTGNLIGSSKAEVVGMSTNAEGQVLVLFKVKDEGGVLCVLSKPDVNLDVATSVSTRKCFKVY